MDLSVTIAFLGCAIVSYVSASVLFPGELTSVLGFIYPWIPPAKIGTDSRLGFGFRLGQNADAQFLVELGPQYNTLPLGETSRKRDISTKNIESTFTGKWKNIFSNRYKYNVVTRIPNYSEINTTQSTMPNSKITTKTSVTSKNKDIIAANTLRRTSISNNLSATYSKVNTTPSPETSLPPLNVSSTKENIIADDDRQTKTPVANIDLPVYLSDKFLVSDRLSANASTTNSLELINKYKHLYPVFSVNVFKLVHSLMHILPDSKT